MPAKEPAPRPRRPRPESASLKHDVDALYKMVAQIRTQGPAADLVERVSGPEFLRLLRRLVRRGASPTHTPPPAELAPTPAPSTHSEVTVEAPPAAAPSAPQPREPSRTTTIALVYSPRHKQHYSPAFPEDSPDRVEAILTQLSEAGFLGDEAASLIDAPAATLDQLRTVHTPEYIEFVRKAAARGPRTLPRSTYLRKGSWEAARRAAGAALKAGELIGAGYDVAFALTRPAGHHATQDTYGGFCLFNNPALVARALAARDRVMIINWDAHASNGTKRIFYADPQVLTISIHRDPVGFFPNEGFVEEIGVGPGQGFSVNVPMPKGSSDDDYLAAFDVIVGPLHRQFRPKYVVVECGFDAHRQDPVGGQRLTSSGFRELGRRLARLQGENLILTLEGGYNANTIGRLAHTLLLALGGSGASYRGNAAQTPPPAPPDTPQLLSVLDAVRGALRPHWEF